MNLVDIRRELSKGKSIFDLPLKVVFYARVSTSTADQLNSLENQASFFKDYIYKNPNWQLVDFYIDEGISGTSVKKRENFLKMIEDSGVGKFNLVLTKEISRFARSTIDSINYTHRLLLNDVGVYFLNDNINTFEPDSELRLTIMSSIVQEEVRKISGRVKFGYREAIKKGRVLGNDKIWGYIKNDGKLVICEQEAEVVRTIFNYYINGYGINTICEKLLQMGYKNQNGNKFTYNTIKNILTNPKYKGYYAGQKTEKIDYRNNKRVKFNKDQWVLYQATEDVVPKIISDEVWDAANKILSERSGKYFDNCNIRPNDKALFSGKIFCKQHNTSYWRSVYKSKSGSKEIWQCKTYRNLGKKGCDNPHLYTFIIDEITTELIKKLFLNDNEVINLLIEIYKDCLDNNRYLRELQETDLKINKINQRKDKLLDLFIDNNIDKNEFNIRNQDMSNQINKLKEIKIRTQHLINEKKCTESEVIKIKNEIQNILNLYNNTNRHKIIDSLVNKIEVYPKEENIVKLDVYFDEIFKNDAQINQATYKDKSLVYLARAK